MTSGYYAEIYGGPYNGSKIPVTTLVPSQGSVYIFEG